MSSPSCRVAVIGAGWAGLSAAVQATSMGHAVTLFEMAHQAGGRARTLPHAGQPLDNGQHILIGAYRDTLALMRRVGVDPEAVLHRAPLAFVFPDGSGLRLPPGPAVPAFVRGVLGWSGVPLADRLRLLWLAARWRMQGFRCDARWTVSQLAQTCPRSLFDGLIEPLCLAALNTPTQQASGQVLLNVLQDALFVGAGASDLLLPRMPLSELLPLPALQWLQRHGTVWRPGVRVHALSRHEQGWQADGETFDHLVLACSAAEASRLMAPHAPTWAARAAALRYEPIVTVWLEAPRARWPEPMMAFPSGPATGHDPAQFGFDLGQLGARAGLFAMVISGAAQWVEQGRRAIADAVVSQWHRHFGRQPPVDVATIRIEQRATFSCTPGMLRPDGAPLPGISVAGDYIAGRYPATLEGAVRSGLAAVATL